MSCPECDRKLHTWELAAWTLTTLVCLVLLAAALQWAFEQDQWSHTVRPQTTTTYHGR